MVEIPMWKLEIIKKFRDAKLKNEKITFIHIPKCAGTFAAQYIKYFKINNKGHQVAEKAKDGLTFGIIRHPFERFQSLLNYRLNEKKPRKDFPKKLHYVYKDKKVLLDEIVDNMSDKEILSFEPFRTLSYWSQNVDLLLTIDEFLSALSLMGFEIKKNFKKLNVSKKKRGNITGDRIQRINKLFKNDLKIYNVWTLKYL